jgi:integrase
MQHALRHRQNVDGRSPSSLRLCSSALRFFSPQVLGRAWQPLESRRAEPDHRLPAVRSPTEVQRLLQALTPLPNRASFTTLSSGGLRLHEALSLQGGDIDGPRHMRPVPRGQGAKDRSLPLPDAPLDL